MRRKKIIVGVAYGLFFAGLVAFFTFETFPFDDARSRVEVELRKASGMNVEIGEMHPWRGLGIEMSDVKMTPADGTPIAVDALRLRLGFVPLLTGKVRAEIELDAFGGTVDATIQKGKGEFPVKATVRDIDLRGVMPLVSKDIPKTLKASLDADVDLTLSPDDLSKTDGTVHLKLGGLGWAGGAIMGLTLDPFLVGDLEGDVTFDDKKAAFKDFAAKSPDLETAIDGQIDLAPKFDASTGRFNFKLKPTPKLLAEKPKIKTLIELGAQGMKAPDGSLSFTLAGPIKKMAVKKGT